MAVDAGSVYSEVRIKTDKLSSDLAIVNSKFSQVSATSTAAATATTQAWTTSISKFKFVAVGAMAAVSVAMKSAMTIANGFEQSMANVASVAGATAIEFEALQKAAEDAGESTRFTASQAADAMYSLASAGLDAADSISALNGVLLLAGATQSDLATTSASMVATLKQFGLESNESARVSNVFAASIANSMGTMEKLTASMTYVGPVAGALNMTLEETVGILSNLYNAGYSGEKAGRALKTILSSLASETNTTTVALTKLGISYQDLNPEVNSFADIVQTLNEAGLSTGEVMSAFGEIAGPQMLSLLSVGSNAITQMTTDITGTNAAAKQYAIQNDTLSGSLDKLKSAVESSAIKMQEQLEPILQDIVDFATKVVVQFNKMPSVIKSFITIMAIAIPVISTGAVAFGALATAAAAAGIAMGTVLLPVVAIGAGLAAVGSGIAAIVKHSEDVDTEKYSTLAEKLDLTVEAVKNVDKAMGDVENRQTFAQMADEIGWGYTEIKRFSNWLVKSTDDIDKFNEGVQNQADKYGLTYSQMVKLIDASGILKGQKEEEFKATVDAVNLEEQAEADRLQAVKDYATENEKRFKRYQAIAAATDELIAKNEQALSDANTKYSDELDAIEKKKELGLLTEEEYNNKKIEANNTLLDSLLKIDDAYVPEDVNAAIISTADEIKDLSAVNADLAATDAAVAQAEADKKAALLEVQKATNTVLGTALSYTRKLEDMKATTGELMELEKARAIANVEYSKASDEAKKAAISAIDAYYKNLKSMNYDELLESYNTKIKNLTASVGDLMKEEEAQAIQSIKDMGYAEDKTNDLIAAVEKYYALLRGQTSVDAFQKDADAKADALSEIEDYYKTDKELFIDSLREQADEYIKAGVDRKTVAQWVSDKLDEYNTEAAAKAKETADAEAQAAQDAADAEAEAQQEALDAKNSAYDEIAKLYKTDKEIAIDAINDKADEYLAAGVSQIEVAQWVADKLKAIAKEEAEAEAEIIKRTQEDIVRSLISSVGSLSSLFSAMSDSATDAIEAELEAKLEALGLADETNLEAAQSNYDDEVASLQKVIDAYDEKIAAAQAAGDAEAVASLQASKAAQQAADEETLAEYQKAIDKEAITEEYEAKKAQLEYKYDMASWYASLASATANNANAILKTMAGTPYPWNIGLAAAQSVAGGIQLGTIAAAKPQPVALATGGVVLPTTGGTLTQQAENGYGELSLNAGPSGEALLSEFASRIASYVNSPTSSSTPSVIQLYINSKLVSSAVAKDFSNGVVKVNLK